MLLFAARLVVILQDVKQVNSPLWLSALNFLAVCLCEEGKTLATAVVTEHTPHYIVHRLDYPSKDG